jgi:hypothetical protein
LLSELQDWSFGFGVNEKEPFSHTFSHRADYYESVGTWSYTGYWIKTQGRS